MNLEPWGGSVNPSWPVSYMPALISACSADKQRNMQFKSVCRTIAAVRDHPRRGFQSLRIVHTNAARNWTGDHDELSTRFFQVACDACVEQPKRRLSLVGSSLPSLRARGTPPRDARHCVRVLTTGRVRDCRLRKLSRSACSATSLPRRCFLST